MTPRDLLSTTLLVAGAFFFFAGTVGLVRFPDVYTRLHALTKADNLANRVLRSVAGAELSLASFWMIGVLLAFMLMVFLIALAPGRLA